MTFDVEQLDQTLLMASAVVMVAIIAVRLTTIIGLPSLLFYLLLGVLLGESGLGIQFDDAQLAHALGFGALVIILTEGGVTTPWSDIRPVIGTGALLATLGVTVSILVMAVAAHYVLDFRWELAILLAAVTAPTDAAAVFSVLRRVPLPRRLTGALEAESGFNDAPTVLLVTLASEGALLEHGILGFFGIVVFELAAGVLIGLAMGAAGAWGLRQAALPASGLYPLAVVTICVLTYSGSSVLHASGFAAVYVAALVLGNSDLPHRAATRSFIEGLGWLSQIGLFVMLGLLVSPDRIGPQQILQAVVAGAILTFVARPLSVIACTAWQRAGLADITFMSWAGLRGAVPVVLATIPLSEGVSGSTRLFHVVFVLVVIDTLVTGPTLPGLAKRLGITKAGTVRELDIEAAPLERMAADLLQIRITKRSKMHGVEVHELRLPAGVSVALVVRDGEIIVPHGRTVLRRGDDVLVVSPRDLKEKAEDRLRVVSERGRLAHWLDGPDVQQP